MIEELLDASRGFTMQIALLLSFVLYFVFKKREEFSKNAADNTAASFMLFLFNTLVIFTYYKEINAWFQAGYDALGIPTLPPEIWDGMPLWLISIIGIIARDFVDYWNHRLMHTRWFWPTHAAHHSDTHVNAFTTYRIHALEGLQMSLGYILLLTWLQIPEALPAVVAFFSIHNMYVHMDLEFRHGPFKLLIASPVFHRWHHADTPAAYGRNLANVMPLWDRLFGTYDPPAKIDAPMGALASGINDTNPVAILIYPFQEWGRLLRGVWRKRVKPRVATSPAPEPRITPGE